MVTGYNVDIKHEGKVYHVQTEDRGRKHPIIETLIYLGGKIIHQARISYAHKNDDATYDEAAVGQLLEEQHQKLVGHIRAGVFDPDRQPFGEQYITDRSFDECVLDYLATEAEGQTLLLAVVGETALSPGQPGQVVVRATHGQSGEPLAGVVVHARILRTDGGPTPLPDTTTDTQGEVRLDFEVPAGDAVRAAILIQGVVDSASDEISKSLV